jgi:hypothetical protein
MGARGAAAARPRNGAPPADPSRSDEPAEKTPALATG